MASINDELDKYPKTGIDPGDCLGKLLHLPRTGLTVVAFQLLRNGASVVVVEGNRHYHRGQNLKLSNKEIKRALPLDWVRPESPQLTPAPDAAPAAEVVQYDVLPERALSSEKS